MVLTEGALELHHQGENSDLNNQQIVPLSETHWKYRSDSDKTSDCDAVPTDSDSN